MKQTRAALTCSVEGCVPTPGVRGACGFCNMHYQRWRKYGDPMITFTNLPDWDRFWPKVDASGDCWIWTGYLNPEGYGNFRSTDHGRTMLSHRWAWEALIGPIPAGYEPDHLCGVRACVYVGAHLVLATPPENRSRAWGITRLNAAKTHCPKGHSLSGENLQMKMNGGRLGRRCATCHRDQERARHQKQRLGASA